MICKGGEKEVSGKKGKKEKRKKGKKEAGQRSKFSFGLCNRYVLKSLNIFNSDSFLGRQIDFSISSSFS